MKKIYFLVIIAVAILCFMLPVQAQPIVPLPIVTMTPSYYTQMAIFCPGGSLRMWEYEKGKGLVYCEAPTPIPTRPTSTPISTRPASTETPRPLYTARPLVGGTIPQVTETPVGHVVNLPFVSNGE